MLKVMLLCACVLGAGAVHAQEVWKCKIGEQIRYSDQPCAAQGEAMAPRVLQGNVVDATRVPVSAAQTAALPGLARPQGPEEGNSCPSDRDISSMQTRASSIGLGREAKQFMQDEIRRARQCRKGQGRYTAADWAISLEAQNAQTSLSGAADARRRAEAMHSAADPLEGERIARQREAEEVAAREAVRRAQLRGKVRPE